MELISKDIPNDCNIYIGGDKHEGTIFKHKKGIEELKYLILSDNRAYNIEMGDIAEAITVDDPRYQPETQDPTSQGIPLEQYINAAREYEPIADRTLLALLGNHDWKLNKTGNFVKRIFCEPLGITYGGYTTILSLTHFGRPLFKTYLTHGFGTLRSTLESPHEREISIKRQLRRKLMNKPGADCLVNIMGHCHQLVVSEPTDELYLTSDSEDIIQHYHSSDLRQFGFIPKHLRWYGASGCFLKMLQVGITSYAEVAGFDPVALGCLLLEVRDGKVHDLKKVLL